MKAMTSEEVPKRVWSGDDSVRRSIRKWAGVGRTVAACSGDGDVRYMMTSQAATH